MANFAVNCWNRPLYFHYQNLIQTYDNLSLTLTNKLFSEKLSSPWLYCKDLVGHFGCVNAVEFSKKGGEYLVSGGDDTRVLVWKLAEAVKGDVVPRCLKRTHLSNIFCASFDSENKYIITAGNDDQILRHNFETGELATCLSGTDATYDVSIHPENDNIFITAGEHGEVDLYDVRAPSDIVKLAKGPLTFHSAVFNPVDPAVFATASSVKGVQLWDARVPLRCLKRFDSNAGSQCAMGISFDQTGHYLASVRQRLPPVLYHIHRNTSLVEFYQEGYYNSCTMKSVCFGGKTDNFIISGSDDFNVYMWEVPKVDKNYEGIMKVNKSFLVLRGHRSIVNQVCFNKHISMLCTAGVEKMVKMWSPFPMAGGKAGVIGEGEGEGEGEQRTLYSPMDYARMILESGQPLAHDYDEELTSEDPRMIAFFDSLVQKDHESSTDSDLSSTDDDYDGDDEEKSSRDVDILRRIRAVVFEQIRNLRENPSEESENDNSTESRTTNNVETQSSDVMKESIEGPMNNTETQSSDVMKESIERPMNNTETQSSDVMKESVERTINNTETQSSDVMNESVDRTINNTETQRSDVKNSSETSSSNGEEGVGIVRLREIITSQQGSTNTRKRIANLRRDCLKNDDTAAITSKGFTKNEKEENGSKESENELSKYSISTKCPLAEKLNSQKHLNEFPECSTSSNPWREKRSSQKHQNEFPERSTSSNPWRKRLSSRKNVSDSSSSSENEDKSEKFKDLTKRRN